MGEYAIRKTDKIEVKIGTCEMMYYLRYEDRDKVEKMPNSLDPVTTKGLFWRLPFPDEDETEIGEYSPFQRGYRLRKKDEDKKYCEDFTCPSLADYPGIIQLRHECGLLINMPCYHGEMLPESPLKGKICWNAKSWFYELGWIKNTADGQIIPVVTCRHCNKMWSCEWTDIIPYLRGEMKTRLEKYI